LIQSWRSQALGPLADGGDQRDEREDAGDEHDVEHDAFSLDQMGGSFE
jgi:hypothetical protein